MKKEFSAKVAVGDIIRADRTWKIDRTDSSGVTTLTQSTRYVKDKGPVPVQLPKGKGAFVDALEGNRDFIVIDTRMTGGGTGMGRHDVYPDGWRVTVQQLDKKGRFDESGLTFQFYQSGCFTCMIPQCHVVGKMKRTFVPS